MALMECPTMQGIKLINIICFSQASSSAIVDKNGGFRTQLKLFFFHVELTCIICGLNYALPYTCNQLTLPIVRN